MPRNPMRMPAFPPTMSGSYTLLVEIEIATEIQVGAFGKFTFDKGLYTYTGSALGRSQSLATRLARHLRGSKAMRWHIDYLLQKARVRAIILCENEMRLECFLNQALGSRTKGIVVARRFGASDCHMDCPAHLYYHPDHEREGLMEEILAVYSSFSANVQCYKFE